MLDPDFSSILVFCCECVGSFRKFRLKFKTLVKNFIIKSLVADTYSLKRKSLTDKIDNSSAE